MLKNTGITLPPDCRINFPATHLDTLYEHCRRKLAARYIDGETMERKAFGLVAGTVDSQIITVNACLPLLKNVRSQKPFSQFMDHHITQHAIPSETPFSKRGWVADPVELFAEIRKMKGNSNQLIGTYHMHRVAWPDDPVRDTPTLLDTVLAADSRLLLFIVSMVNPEKPIVRAFYEGMPDREIPIIIEGFSK